MKSDKNYNWWTDPKNAEEVKQVSWWEHEENKAIFNLPISIIEQGGHWTVGFNNETEKILGSTAHAVTSGDSKEEAIDRFFSLIRAQLSYQEECRLNYQRFVPFRKGSWGTIGGTWFVVFGIHIYLRTGKNMRGGWYIPFTKLNISIHSEWRIYKRWKKEHKNKN